MKRFSRRLGIGALVLISILVIILVWLVLQHEKSPREAIRYGYLPIASDASFFVALEHGFFADQGLLVTPIRFETSNHALEALVAGRIDATAVVALEAALALEANTPEQFSIIEMTAATAGTQVHRIVVRTDSPVHSLADLRGSTIGTFPGSQMVVFLKLILGKYFDAERDIDIIQLRPPLQPQALETGRVAALFCLEPTGTLVEARGIGRTLAMNPLVEYIQEPFPTAAGLVSRRLATQRPDVSRKIEAALRAAHDFIGSNPREAARVLPSYVPIEPELAERVALYEYWGLEAIDRSSVQALADLYAAHGILSRPVMTANLYADSVSQ